MDPSNTKTSTKGEARRRLLRGTVAAPAVLSVYSGRSVAGSAAMCVANAVNVTKATPTAEIAGSDAYLRVQLWSVKKGDATKESYWLKGADVVPPILPAGRTALVNTFLPATQWMLIRRRSGGSYTSMSPGDILTTGTPHEGAANPVKNGPFQAIRFDANGNFVGVVGINGNPGFAVTGTCWSSFMVRPL